MPAAPDQPPEHIPPYRRPDMADWPGVRKLVGIAHEGEHGLEFHEDLSTLLRMKIAPYAAGGPQFVDKP